MKKFITRSIGGFINMSAVLFPKWNGKFLFNLLCKVKRVGISEEGVAFFAKGETTFLKVGNHESALHKWGNGPKKLLFLHGWLSNSQRWMPYVEELDLNEYSIYALDAPGHGMAEGNYLNIEIYRKAVVQATEIIGEVDTLLCHSLGSLVGSYAYLAQNELPVNKYVIMGSPSGMDAIFLYFREMLGLSKKALINLEVKINSVLQLPHEKVSLAHFFQKIERPVLVVHEISDKIAPFDPIKKASEAYRRLETFFVSGQDHNLKGEETLARVIQFIK